MVRVPVKCYLQADPDGAIRVRLPDYNGSEDGRGALKAENLPDGRLAATVYVPQDLTTGGKLDLAKIRGKYAGNATWDRADAIAGVVVEG